MDSLFKLNHFHQQPHIYDFTKDPRGMKEIASYHLCYHGRDTGTQLSLGLHILNKFRQRYSTDSHPYQD